MSSRYIGVGIFAIVGTALFATALFLIGNQHDVFSKHIELFTEVKNLNGLAKGAKVRVWGFDGGEVTAIGVPQSPSAGFRLTFRINDQVRALVATDSVATILTERTVVDKFILTVAGRAPAAKAAPSSTIPSKETSDMAELIQKSTALVENT